MGRFVNLLKARTRSLHSSAQLQGIVAPRQMRGQVTSQSPTTIAHFARYLADQRAVHGVLEKFPVRLPVDVREALDTDLWFLELEAWQVDMPWLLQDPYHSDYAAYLTSLDTPRLGCHFYNLVFAHLVGGNRRVAEAALPEVLPRDWLDTSEFYRLPARVSSDDLEDLRDRLEGEARRWSRADRRACLEETAEAFARASRLNSILK